MRRFFASEGELMPFDVVACSWPRPVEHEDGYWSSEPEWDAPVMRTLPEPGWMTINGERCWTIDWQQFFGGQMRGFHVVFRLKINRRGRLVLWTDDGCVIRRNGQIIHSDRAGHMPIRSELDVGAGDRLEVAQWQYWGGWLWGAAGLDEARPSVSRSVSALLPYLPKVEERLANPNGPVLKMHTHGASPVRALVCLYSMILNGYAPDGVQIFGAHQWDPRARSLFTALAPFADIVQIDHFLDHIRAIGGPRLAEMAGQHWFVMKAFATLLYPPQESCLMDDDVFVLDSVEDALDAFQTCDLVFAPDFDWTNSYRGTWHWINPVPSPLPTGTFNAALYWIRPVLDPHDIAEHALRSEPGAVAYPYQWEQGLIAMLYASRHTRRLPSQRFFYPVFDGLPAGTLGYDYVENPCRFASIHFGSNFPKPSDADALELVPKLLSRHRDATIRPSCDEVKQGQLLVGRNPVIATAKAASAAGSFLTMARRHQWFHRAKGREQPFESRQ